MRIAISLVWIRHNSSGGVESYTRNILDGLKKNCDTNQYILICSRDNAKSFFSYKEDPRFEIIECDVFTRDAKKMLVFESFKLDRLVSKLGADLCFVPCYRMPLFFSQNKYVVVIHDLVAYWYPNNFRFLRRNWLQWGWHRSIVKSKQTVAISQFVKNDIIERYYIKDERKIRVIYNPVLPSREFEDFEIVAKDYGIERYDYFYTVSSPMKHKNLITIIRLMSDYVRKYGKENTPKLLISGIGMVGPEAKTHFETDEVLSFIKEESLEDVCIMTGFVTNGRRNTLLQNAKLFLFPSVFEGFGMPPVEALEMGTPVITTKCTALPETTQGKCMYINNPYDVDEWINAVEECKNAPRIKQDFEEYKIDNVITQYLDCFNTVAKM